MAELTTSKERSATDKVLAIAQAISVVIGDNVESFSCGFAKEPTATF